MEARSLEDYKSELATIYQTICDSLESEEECETD